MIWQVVVLMIGRWDWYLTRVSIPVEGPHSMIRYVHGIRYEMGHTNLLLEQVLVVGLLIWLASLTRSVDCGMGLVIYFSINLISEGVPIHIRALVHFPSVPGLWRKACRPSLISLTSESYGLLLPNSLWERILTLAWSFSSSWLSLGSKRWRRKPSLWSITLSRWSSPFLFLHFLPLSR